MSEMYGVIGPLVEPATRTGVHFQPAEMWRICSCDLTAGQGCEVCSGDDADAYELRRAHRAPSRRSMTDAQVMRIVEACRSTTTETSGDAA